jgi:hypothetical protein
MELCAGGGSGNSLAHVIGGAGCNVPPNGKNNCRTTPGLEAQKNEPPPKVHYERGGSDTTPEKSDARCDVTTVEEM